MGLAARRVLKKSGAGGGYRSSSVGFGRVRRLLCVRVSPGSGVYGVRVSFVLAYPWLVRYKIDKLRSIPLRDRRLLRELRPYRQG